MNNLLITDPDKFFSAMQEFTGKLNEAPVNEWIEQHEGWDYIPVSIIETQLSLLFYGTHKFEILTERTEVAEQVLTVRIHYFHPVAQEWMFQDGIGAAWLDFSIHNPLKSAGALAYSEAIKVGAKKLGKRFGSDLNRKETGDYGTPNPVNEDMQPITSKIKIAELSEVMIKSIAECQTTEQVVELFDGNKNMHSNREFVKLIMNRKTAIKNGN